MAASRWNFRPVGPEAHPTCRARSPGPFDASSVSFSRHRHRRGSAAPSSPRLSISGLKIFLIPRGPTSHLGPRTFPCAQSCVSKMLQPENSFLDRRTGFTGLTRAVSESGEPHKTIQRDSLSFIRPLCSLCPLWCIPPDPGSLQFFLTSHPPPDRKQCCENVTIVFFAADDFFKTSQPANPKNNSDLPISKS